MKLNLISGISENYMIGEIERILESSPFKVNDLFRLHRGDILKIGI